MTDQSAVLPAELLVYSFSHLEQPDILRVSGVSARWRALAMEDRNYYQHISYHFRSPHETRRVADHLNYIFAAASAFEKAMRRFCASETKPRLNVTFRAVNSSSSLYDFDQDDFREMILPTVLPELQRSMTHVVNLALIVDAIYWPDVSEVLHLPAPRLESLDIRLRYGRQLALKPRGYQLPFMTSTTSGTQQRRCSIYDLC
ncbi:hypothetical protein BKA62DRAFT_670473 [Auriculariales sp. MPI-PUGE-AT-0066]|nr:hypothetical protein BKA62DRAFT_670473 [Auriculariales sp. MPI-PUGE-AT-0066]